ncbi:hypothetical protein ACFXAZ_33245 [Streptomyces sp. NPDC059477]|uniref:hypothetical protein n=1 Tax=Streptomyces sp. NPDC059477 TaxID=3346847 RepID=UPI0036C0ED7B
MSAYTTAYQALTAGRPLSPAETARLLSQLRKETGDELAAALERELDGRYRRGPTDTDGSFRRKRRDFGAAMSVVNRLRDLAASPLPTTPPHQRNREHTP